MLPSVLEKSKVADVHVAVVAAITATIDSNQPQLAGPLSYLQEQLIHHFHILHLQS